MLREKRIYIISALLLFTSLLGFSQGTKFYSPFSIEGIGLLREQNQVQNIGMGGLGFAMSDTMGLSLKNPASSAYLKYTVFEYGSRFGFGQFKSSTQTGTYNDIGLAYLAFGLPINPLKGINAVFGLQPVSKSGFYTEKIAADTSRFESHEYSGGLSNLFVNLSAKPLRNLSLGIQTGYTFGKLSYFHDLEFPKSDDYPAFHSATNYSVRGLSLKGGIHYRQSFYAKSDTGKTKVGKPESFLDYGFTYTSSGINSVTTENFAYNYFFIGSSVLVTDTAAPKTNNVSRFNLPGAYGFGLMYSKLNSLRIGLDMNYALNSQLNFPALENKQLNSLSLTAGGSIIPNNKKNAKLFLFSTQYSFGLSYSNAFSTVNQIAVNRLSTSFGMNIPVKSFRNDIKSKIRISVQAGKIGTLSSNALTQNFVNFYVGFSMNEKWFVRKKID